MLRADIPDDIPEEKQVPEVPEETKKAQKNGNWQNIALAVGAVAVAAVALILVGTNKGHKN